MPEPGEEGAAVGPVLFARYAYPPNALGYCGADDPAALIAAASGGRDVATLRELASRFEGAWPYLRLIAASNGITDPLDARVTKAYWVGNALLERVPPETFASWRDECLARPVAGRPAPFAEALRTGGVPHHSFHVFAVYPWLGLLRAGIDGPPLMVLDRCRIRWGRVEATSGDRVIVSCQKLRFDGSRLALGDEELEENRVSVEGTGFVDGLVAGEIVSLHWDWVCDRLSPQDLSLLRHYTKRNLAVVNGLDEPGRPAAPPASG